MLGGGIIGRVITYVAGELIVNGLVKSPGFQRFMGRTSKKIEEVSYSALQKKRQIAEQMKEVSKNFESSNKNQ